MEFRMERMSWLQKTANSGRVIDWAESYPVAGAIVDGRQVTDDIDNISSVRATIMWPTFLEDIREVPLSDFSAPPSVTPRTLALAEEIRNSNIIMPLIVAFDNRGPWILEGGHRYDALKIIGAHSFPAMVVVDSEEAEGSIINEGEV